MQARARGEHGQGHDDEGGTMKLVELVEAGDVAGVVRELGVLTPDQRAACAAELTAFFEVMARRENTLEERIALCAARLGCQVTPEATAVWIRTNPYFTMDTWTVDLLDLFPVAWRTELVAHLGERATTAGAVFAVTEHLVRDTGCPLPTSHEFVLAWLYDRAGAQERHPRVLGGAPGADFLERLRADDFTPKLLPLAVARPGRLVFAWHTSERPLEALVGLAAEGVVDRDELIHNLFADMVGDPPHGAQAVVTLEALALTPAEHAGVARERAAVVDHLLGRLLEDGTRMEIAPFLVFLRALASTPAEKALVVRDYLALLDRSLPVATYAQEVLTGLDEAGLLEPELLSEACERVLLRPEKKLVRAQLGWLGRVARRDPAQAGRAMVDAATTFGHREMTLQEQALKLVAKHLKAADDSVLPELRAAAGQLSPGLSARAAELLGTVEPLGAANLFGTSEDTGTEQPHADVHPYADVLPAVPEPHPVPGPIATAAEVAQEVAAVVANDQDVVAFERALDGLVRHAHLDRTALAEALKPVMRREPKNTVDWVQSDLYDVARAVRGDEPRGRAVLMHRAVHINRTTPSRSCSLAGSMLAARLAEAMDVIESSTQPFLLAVPTLSTGALDAAVLVERISALDELGVTPAPVDLAQALLRVTPTPDQQALNAAEKLASDAGQRLARWLREGGPAHQDSEPKGWPHCKPPKPASQGWWTPARPGVVMDPPLPQVAAALIGPYVGNSGLANPMAPFWVAQLPHHRAELMARDYFEPRMSQRGWPRNLPFVVESGGPAGYSVHLALAFGLIWQTETDAVVDAVLVLAARKQLDTDLLGRQLEALLNHGWAYADKASGSLRTAAETGAYATVWSVLRVALPGLLGETPVRGAAAMLDLAVECASRCGAKGEIPEVTAVADRKGSSQTVKNARLLRDALR
ncbi:DUF6493 family protein [Streptomyces phaeochromogenes]|uniref:DUF6493 family protein n=1 Tax=Streptomyces phaeochromogenes TaxID=1923 RepID=A0ABZ1H4R5_STRPH|nr:DUF6493 family protein [Streptomyces phaeochromogenes]WSD13542.1 DUF6493 family protein [Streptomyces phaeochromogenes]